MNAKLKKVFKQAIHFFAISGIGWLLDLIIYSILSNFILIGVANILSSSVAVTYVYLTSTRKIFANNNNYNLKVKYVIYLCYQICIILLFSFIINELATYIINNVNILFIYKYANICAKIIVTPVTMITNFIFMKILIEKF